MRAGAFGWRGTAKAVSRLKAAMREIKAIRKTDPVAAGEGVIALAERIWPAFEHIDTSSGSLGTAVAHPRRPGPDHDRCIGGRDYARGLGAAVAHGYPDRDPRAVLEDVMAHHGRKGKWFAAAKTAGYLDLALDCAADHEAAPATLIRAARDFTQKAPAFAASVALHAIVHLLAKRGFEPSPIDIDDAVAHLMTATRQIDRMSWALEQLRRVAGRTSGEDLMVKRLRLVTARLEGEIGAEAN